MPFDSNPTESNETITLLLKIRNEIASGHWCKKMSADGRGNRCIAGWYMYFTGQSDFDIPVKPFYQLFGEDVVIRNDHPWTNKKHMVDFINTILAKEELKCRSMQHQQKSL